MGKKRGGVFNPKDRHRFFLNPYTDCAFTRCPKCENKTRLRKIPLAIHLERQKRILCLNCTSKYCPYCDLLIARKQKIEESIKHVFGLDELREGEYFIMGTLERSTWRKMQGEGVEPKEQHKAISFFKDVWTFEMQPAGWYVG